jgi:hypothetical protein
MRRRFANWTRRLLGPVRKKEPAGSPAYAGFEAIHAEKNRFIIVGDTQSTSHWEFWRERNERQRQVLLDEILRRDPAFILHLGDLTTRGSSLKHWWRFDALHAPLRERNIPYFPVLGNHEFYGNDRKALRYFFGRFPHLEERRWYSFSWRNLAFILLDSNFDTLSPLEHATMVSWYATELERFEDDPAVDFVIVCSHKPPFTNSRVVSACKKTRWRFAAPFLRSRKTRFYFSGHSHTYERFPFRDKHFVVSGGGGGPRHRVAIHPRRRYPDVFAGPALRFFHACEMELGGGLSFRVIRLEPEGTFGIVDPLEMAAPLAPL